MQLVLIREICGGKKYKLVTLTFLIVKLQTKNNESGNKKSRTQSPLE